MGREVIQSPLPRAGNTDYVTATVPVKPERREQQLAHRNGADASRGAATFAARRPQPERLSRADPVRAAQSAPSEALVSDRSITRICPTWKHHDWLLPLVNNRGCVFCGSHRKSTDCIVRVSCEWKQSVEFRCQTQNTRPCV
eukprot:244608-Prorocentrum_minimum.AAC.4